MTFDPDDIRANPDAFVALIPCPWEIQPGEFFSEIHADFWLEEASYELEPLIVEESGVVGVGTILFGDDTQVRLSVEEPIRDLVELAFFAREPFAPEEIIALEKHLSLWHISVQSGQTRARKSARRFGQILGTFVEAGAAGVFLPGILSIHSPRFIQRHGMDLNDPQALANIFVSAWDRDDWMRSRGLTAFGLPEVETPIDEGHNAAYFRIMDVATNMIFQMSPYPPDAKLQLGPKLFRTAEGPRGPEDQEVPVNGSFGVVSVLPE